MDTKSDNRKLELDFERSLGFLTQDVARLMRLAFDRKVRHLGLTPAQWFVLGHLVREDGQRQVDLAQAIDMEKAPLGKLIDRLQEGGWVERRPDPDDKRANRVHRTAKIDPHIPELHAAAFDVYATALGDLGEATRERLIDELIVMKRNLIASLDDTCEK
jgi:MarR family transcriptional regulator, transcriptional regulator for hemolysin